MELLARTSKTEKPDLEGKLASERVVAGPWSMAAHEEAAWSHHAVGPTTHRARHGVEYFARQVEGEGEGRYQSVLFPGIIDWVLHRTKNKTIIVSEHIQLLGLSKYGPHI